MISVGGTFTAKAVVAALDRMGGRKLGNGLKSVCAKAARRGRKRYRAYAKKAYGLKASDMGAKNILVLAPKPKARSYTATIQFESRVLSLTRFGYSPKPKAAAGPNPNRKHVRTGKLPGQRSQTKVTIGGKTYTIAHGFVAKMASGHVGVFERGYGKRKRGETIQELFSLSLPGSLNNKRTYADIEKEIGLAVEQGWAELAGKLGLS